MATISARCIEDLQEEVRELRTRLTELQDPITSGIAELTTEAEAQVIESAENILARGLNVREAFFMGKLLGTFKTTQVSRALLQKRHTRDPIRSAYAMLVNGAFGKPSVKPVDKSSEQTHWAVPENYDPWDR